MSEVISTKRIRNNEANRKHQTTYMSDPEKKEKHNARMREYYQNNKEKIRQRSRERQRRLREERKNREERA